MLSALICSELSYPAMPLTRQPVHQRLVKLGPLVLEFEPLNFPTPTEDRGPNCLATFWTQLACHFNRRTAEPLGPSPAPGCDEPTSRCQTAPSIWTLGRDQPVIPDVPFVRWAMAIPHSYHRIICTYFRTCSTCKSHSQAPFYAYALRMVTNHAEGTLVLLRYFLGGNRPSQTNPQALFNVSLQRNHC